MSNLLWLEEWEALEKKFQAEGYDALTVPERLWYSLHNMIDAMESYGIAGLYCSKQVEYLPEIMEDLASLGFLDLVDKIEKLNHCFLNHYPPANPDVCCQILEEMEETSDKKLMEEINDLFFESMPDLEAKLDLVIASIVGQEPVI